MRVTTGTSGLGSDMDSSCCSEFNNVGRRALETEAELCHMLLEFVLKSRLEMVNTRFPVTSGGCSRVETGLDALCKRGCSHTQPPCSL